MEIVKSGQGFDLWSERDDVLESIFSLNPFAVSYSEYAKTQEDPHAIENYTLKEEDIYLRVLRYAKESKRQLENATGLIEMEDGTTRAIDQPKLDISLIVPIEADRDRALFQRLQKRIHQETGVAVHVYFHEKALIP